MKMTVKDFAANLNMTSLTGESGLDKEVSGIYVGDLLSWVMSHAEKGNAWITVHTHVNIVAVALLAEVSCIIVPESINVDEETIKRAIHESIAILSTSMITYEICYKAHDVLDAGKK